jgi:D-alanyl-D-alanine carboxypeptidase
LNSIGKLFAGILALSAVVTPSFAQTFSIALPPASPALIEPATPAPKTLSIGPRYAAALIDARTGEVLYANAFRELRHPASITKVMTLFLAFDALASGTLKLTDSVPFSAHAVSQRPSRLGLAAGKSITVDQAIRIIAVKSANDVAVALAEKIAGSEPAFVAMMTHKARVLGMRDTVYANASGLPNPANVTTAYDIALLSAALMRIHPDRYGYFSQQSVSYGNQTFTNHNHLLGKVIGMDGIKTGYTLDAGFTLAASAVRDGRRLIAVVLGEPSIAARNRDVSALLDAGFIVFQERSKGVRLAVTDALPVQQHPAFRIGPDVEQGSNDDAKAAPKSKASKTKAAHKSRKKRH